jgi:hypothetical protein
MPRNGPQPGEGESERSVTTDTWPTPPKTNPRPWLSQRGVSRNETFDTMFAALLFDLCRGAHDPPSKEPKDQAHNDHRSKMAYVHVRSARPSWPKCESENGA